MLLALGLLFQSTGAVVIPEPGGEDDFVFSDGSGAGQILLLMKHQKMSNRYPVSSR